MQRFLQEQPEVPVYLLDVIRQRPLSREVAAHLGIEHESPQAILLRGGAVRWHASHYDITAEALAAQVREP